MDVVYGPNSVDEPSLLYKLQRKIKVFNTNQPLPNRGYNLVACTSKYGLVFVATPIKTLSVYQLKELIDKDTEPSHLSVKLQGSPTHVSVNCNEEWLAVFCGQMLLVYKCHDFQNADVRPSVSIKCDVSPSNFVSSLQWNPCMPETIGIVFFDGTLLVSQVNTMQMKKIQSKARCLCWSPKGKQLVTGNSDGTLSQYKPDLSPMKTVPAPNLFDGAPVEALAIYWIATYQFAVAYKNATDNSRPAVVIVNTPKGQPQPSCANYEDICYSMGSNRPWYYYLQGLPQWNLILASSSNSMEIATLASPDGANWVQWCQSDEARPELPLTDKKQENYPVGVCIDTAAVHQIPWGENESLPPMPLLHVVSQTGLLSVFNVINLSKHAPPLCAPPQPLALPSAALTRALPDDVSAQADPPAAVPLALPKAPPPQYHAPPPAQQPTPVQPTNVAPPTAPNVSFGMTKEPISAALQSTAPNVSLGMKKEPTPPAALEANNPVPKPTPQPTSAQAAAAILVEQEKIDKAKLNQKLKNMLIKEVNDFNMEMYKFTKLTQEKLIKLQRDIEAADLSMSVEMDADRLRKECAIDELREAVVQLKLEMVRACAVVAEARTQAEAKDLQEWTQADPLTIKRISSVKKLAYYVQTQLEHARRALDHKWNEMSARDEYGKAGERMIRPVLDDVYQPLVKQQEILCRQAAVLRALRTTASECSSEPAFSSASLLRTTPFKNKDHLSKLTKNILNMSIEPQSKARDSILSAQKLDALRDILSNHKPIKIKPVSFELRQHLEAMKQRYEMAKEKTMKESRQEMEQLHIQKPEPFYPTLGQAQPQPKVEPLTAPVPQATMFQQNIPQNNWQNDSNVFAGKTFGASTAFAYTHPTLFGSAQKPDIAKESPISIPTYTPVNVKAANPAAGVARTLFTEEKKEEKPKGFQEPPQPPQQTNDEQPKHFPPNINSYTKSQLRKFILKDSSNDNNQQANEPKNDANTFMGQKICSPSFNFTKQSGTPSQPSTIFTTKFQNVTPEKVPTANPKSNETGEPDSVPVTDENKSQGDKTENKSQGDKTEKPITNMFTLKSNVTFGNKNQGIPDVLKGGQSFAFGKGGKDDKPAPTAEGAEKKETQEKQTRDVKKENETKPVQQAFNKPPAQSVIFVDLKKPAGEAKVETVPSSVFNFSTAAPPPAGAKLQFDIGPMTTQQSSVFETAKQSATQESSQKTSTDGTAHKEEAESTPTTIPEKSTPTTTFDTIPTTTSSDTTPTTTSSDTTPTTTSSDTTPTTTSSDTTPTTTSSDTTATTTSSDTTPTTTSSDTTPTTTSDAIPIPTSSDITSTTIPTSATSTPTSEATTQNDTKDSQNVTTSNAVSSTTSGSIFTAVTTSTPAFGTEETKGTKPSIFGTNTPAFGATQPSAFASNASSLFASASASAFGTQTTKSSIFSPNTTSQSASIFGTSPTTTASVFGSSPQSIFSGASTSMFGGTPTSTQNIFGTPTTQASVFGSGQSVFGSSGSPSQVFGAPATQASIFGTSTPTTQTSIFGTPTQTTQASPFGTPPATSASVFGTPTTTQGSLFGGAESNLFASATISTTSAPSQPTGNIFGGSSGSVFGNATNIFGGKPSFGTSTSAASIFGGASSFGQKPATDFWSGGGSNTGGFGTPAFGQPATTQASIFGGSGGSFSTPSSGQPFGSPGPFSGGDTKPSVFGTPPQQQASAFGGSPMFGSKPVFGGSPTFGSTGFGGFNKSPTSGFGAPAAFGGGAFGGSSFGSASPGKAFGAAAPTGFGSPTQSNAMFESLATQNTLTFGNLAQQSGQAPQPAPTQHLQSPSFTGWRG